MRGVRKFSKTTPKTRKQVYLGYFVSQKARCQIIIVNEKVQSTVLYITY